jgi:hypothetical protein
MGEDKTELNFEKREDQVERENWNSEVEDLVMYTRRLVQNGSNMYHRTRKAGIEKRGQKRPKEAIYYKWRKC